jgi:hypothetical protein
MIRFAVLAFACLCLIPRTTCAGIIMTIAPDGNGNVVATASGTIDTAALTFNSDITAPAQLYSDFAFILVGPVSPSDGNYFRGVSGPTTFGNSNSFMTYPASSGSGNFVGIDGFDQVIALPAAYISGNNLVSTSTWDNATLDGFGLTLGTYTWTWGTGPTADFFQVAIVPEPSSFILLGCVLGLALGSRFCWRRRTAAAG